MFLFGDFNIVVITELSNTLAFLIYAILLLAKLKLMIKEQGIVMPPYMQKRLYRRCSDMIYLMF